MLRVWDHPPVLGREQVNGLVITTLEVPESAVLRPHTTPPEDHPGAFARGPAELGEDLRVLAQLDSE